ncbi:MAG: hypothetical protein AB1801_24355 [Chloroflexota bacterium]
MTKQILADPKELIFIQSRAETNHDLVDEYAAMMRDDVQFDAAQGVQDKTGQIFVWDGHHRGEAAKRAEVLLLVEVQPGTQHDAEWLALSANQKHGLRRSKADEEWIARTALLKFPDRSVREIHRHTGINRRKISAIRDELVASGAIAPDNKVTVSRGGITYEQDTTNIGGTQPAYAPIWKLETAIHQWLSDGFEDLAEQLQVLTEIKEKTPTGQHHLNQLLADDRLPSPKRKGDVIQACHNVLEQLRPKLQASHSNSVTLESNIGLWSSGFTERDIDRSSHHQPTADPQAKYSPRPQAFECPRCGREKIVGINGSRRWCLNCGAEWPTAADFLTEVNAAQNQTDAVPTRTELQQRFLNILASLGEQDRQLIQVEIWLDELERRLVLSADLQPVAETVAPILSLHSSQFWSMPDDEPFPHPPQLL